MDPNFDPRLSAKVIMDIEAAIKRSLDRLGAPAVLTLPGAQVPLEQMIFVFGWKCRFVPADELGGEPERGERGVLGWPDGLEDTKPA